jgi:DNA invertase Pin-like site-specific DNA recombinase/predicted  nucleic acid-binding Zn-ribbon protein
MEKQIKAAAYLRVSTKEQNEDTQLPDIKIQALRDEADLIEKFIFRDRVSGLKGKDSRAGLNDLLELSNADIDIVYIWEVSRLSREPLYFEELITAFRKKHINICFLKPSPLYLFNIHTGEEELTTSLALSIFSKFALFEIQQKNQRTQRGRNEAILTRNEAYSLNAPYGYRKENKKFVIDNEQITDIEGFRTPAEVVQRIFEMYNKGKTLATIARLLNEYHIQTNCHKILKKDTLEYPSGITVSKDALIWRKGTVTAILANTAYAGYKLINSNIKTNGFDSTGKPLITRKKNTITTPAIISEATYLASQEQKKLNTTAANKAVKSEYLLRGVLKCGHCDNHYICACRARIKIYLCADKARKHKATYKGCQGNTINAYRLEYMIWESVKEIYRAYAHWDRIEISQGELNVELEKIRFSIKSKESNIKANEKKIDNTVSRIANINSNRAAEAAGKEIEKIEKEISIQEKELQALKLKEADLLKNFNRIEELRNYNYDNYDITSVENSFILKQEAVKRIVKEITVYEAKADSITNKETYDEFCRIIIIRLYVINGHDMTVLYNPDKGDYIHFSDSLLKFDKERLLFGVETQKQDLTNEYNLSDEPDYSYSHPVMIYHLFKGKVQIPRAKKIYKNK